MTLLPPEQVEVSSMVTSGPSRWSAAVLGALSLALVAIALLTLLGSSVSESLHGRGPAGARAEHPIPAQADVCRGNQPAADLEPDVPISR